MAFNNTVGRSAAKESWAPMQQNNGLGWKDLATKRIPPGRRRRRNILIVTSVLLLVALTFAAIRIGTVASGTDDQLQIHIGSQQAAALDLRQSSPISPYLLGTNVFPKDGTSSFDKYSSGFMHYTPFMSSSLRGMHVKFLRYPGGNWGEDHVLSYEQLDDFTNMLIQTGSEGMLQAHLSGPVKGQPADLTNDVSTGARLAGSWVDYLNNRDSTQRTNKNAPFHPVKFWTVGNEPDLGNRVTKQKYTVDQYVQIFIQYSKQMHLSDPSIKVFGPEMSQFYGVGAGPFDAKGHPWMDDFLKGVGAYEKAHPELGFHLLDGISLHRYPFDNARQAPALLMSSTDEWNYLLPSLQTLIKQDLGRYAPIAVTEVNTNPGTGSPSRGQAALWWADTLGTLMNQQVEYVGFFSAADVEQPYPLFIRKSQSLTAMGRVMQVFSHLQHNLVPLSIQREPISVYATQDDTHQTLSLLFVNKSPTPQLAQIRSLTRFATVSSWPSLDVHLAGDSVIVVTLHRGTSGKSEAYSYIAQANDTLDAADVTHTVCGHDTDPLASYIPC